MATIDADGTIVDIQNVEVLGCLSQLMIQACTLYWFVLELYIVYGGKYVFRIKAAVNMVLCSISVVTFRGQHITSESRTRACSTI